MLITVGHLTELTAHIHLQDEVNFHIQFLFFSTSKLTALMLILKRRISVPKSNNAVISVFEAAQQ